MLDKIKFVLNQLRNSHNLIVRGIVAIICAWLLVWSMPIGGGFKFEYELGKPWLHPTLTAPFNFAIQKPKALIQIEEQQIKDNAKPYFTYFDTANYALLDTLNDLPMTLGLSLKQSEIIQNGIGHLLQSGIYPDEENLAQKPAEFEVVVVKQNIAQTTPLSNLYNLSQADQHINKLLDSARLTETTRQRLYEVAVSNLDFNLVYDAEKSEMAIADALADLPRHYGLVLKDEAIISNGEIVSDTEYRKLNALREAYALESKSEIEQLLQWTGKWLFAALFILGLLFVLNLFHFDSYNKGNRFPFVLITITFFALLTGAFVRYNIATVYLIPYTIIPILIRAFFDIRLAIAVHFISMLGLALLVPNSFEFFVLQSAAGLTAIAYLKGLRKRSQILLAMLLLYLAYVTLFSTLHLIRQMPFDAAFLNTLLQFGWACLFTILIYPSIFVFERIFGFISEITLVELGDTNHPLLRQLSETAPGTFQHSLQVANLSEKAAIATAANPLLVRIGALYHDIGKMKNPMFFIENQLGKVNPHEKLAPHESAKVIINHVKHGVELAKAQNLPDIIIDFIRTHHGDTRVEYFYFKQNQIATLESDSAFRYRGPKPFSKETAILMMADAVEAASRSLKSHTKESIGALVDQIIDKQIADEQFMNAKLTFKDITTIKKLFKQMLSAIYHVRIEYPKV